MSFDYSSLKSGDLVDVSTEWDFSNHVAGVVYKAEPDCMFIQVLGSPDPPLEFCWHLDDERMATGNERFKTQQDLLSGAGETEHQGPRTGCFRRSRSQELIQMIPEKLASFERVVANLVSRVSAIENAPKPVAPAPATEQPKRPRGRPRKLEPATVG